MIFLTLHQEKYGNKKNLNIFFLDSTDDYDLSSIPFEIRNMVNYSYLLSIFKNIKIPFPYVFFKSVCLSTSKILSDFLLIL